MKVTLESTAKIVELRTPDGGLMPARVWQGVSAAGVRCHAYIVRVAVADGENVDEFERELQQHAPMRPELGAIPPRMVI